MRLFIAEKKVLAEAIADALGSHGNARDGVISVGDDEVVWCSGHLLTLKEPEEYDERYKKWSIADLPIYFDGWQNSVPKENQQRVRQIGELLKGADMVVNCGDTDEEGQLLVDEILRWHHYRGPCMRLDTANTTTDALRKALANMKDNRECEAAGWSAYAREVADMTFGVNLSRFFTKTYNTKLPVGRVMTPTLGLVVNRDRAIEGHRKTYYYTLKAKTLAEGSELALTFAPDKGLEADGLEDGKFLSDGFLKELAESIKGQRGTLSARKERASEKAPLPFNLTELNNYCGRKWGYNPDKVMKLTQELRDGHSAITYNRSDCQYLSSEHHKEAPQTVAAACANIGLDASKFDCSIKGRCFNDANITAHFAIIPTAQRVDTGRLTEEQRNVYEAICVRYLIQFMPDCEKERTVVEMPATLGGRRVGTLSATGTVVMKPGFRSVAGEEGAEEKEKGQPAASALQEGEHACSITGAEIQQNETKPPKRYTQTSLYDDMTKISKYVDDPEIKKLLLQKDAGKKGENGSIGTSATRASIIKKLIDDGYLEERKERGKAALHSTEMGRKFYDLLPDQVKKADVTAKWWSMQEDIRSGKADYKLLTEDVLALVRDTIGSYHADPKDAGLAPSGAKAICKCPSCGRDIASGKYGPYCTGKCGFRMAYAFGQRLTERQLASLCEGKRTKITGIRRKSGDGTFDAFAVPDGLEDFEYESGGKRQTGKRIKLTMSFK